MNTTLKIFLAILTITVITVIGWYLLNNKKEVSVISFSENGNLIKDNSGLAPGVWHLLYEQPGSPALTAELLLTPDSICTEDGVSTPCSFDQFAQGMKVYVQGSLQDNKVTVQTLNSQTSDEEKMNIKLYYYNPALDQGPGGTQCTEKGLVVVERTIPKTITPLTESINLLLRGKISSEEKAKGVTSEFPLAGVTLQKASISNGVATLTFNDPQNKTGGGSCRVSILWKQIEATAKQFPTVTSVVFMPEELFQP